MERFYALATRMALCGTPQPGEVHSDLASYLYGVQAHAQYSLKPPFSCISRAVYSFPLYKRHPPTSEGLAWL